jgi:hypothetical protein
MPMLRALPFIILIGFHTAVAKDTALAQYSGSWAVKPNLCGQPPTLENTYPLEISDGGKRISNYEISCEVIKVREKGRGSYFVRSLCETEGDPDFINEIFNFTSTKVTIQNIANGTTSEFFRCDKNGGQLNKTSGTVRKSIFAEIVKGRCHMDYCGFTKLGKTLSEVKTKSGKLLNIQYLSASVHAPQNNSDRDQYADIKIPNFKKSTQNDLFVHCSKTRPFTAIKGGNGLWQGLLLNLPDGGAAYTTGPAAIFWAVCEGIKVDADLVYSETSTFTKLGYGNQWKANIRDDIIEFQSMDDIRALANQ